MIGLARGTVKVVPYSFNWKELYKQEEKILYNLLGKTAIDIQHVGSTSIEGLDSKPIIDIAVGVKSLDDVDKFRTLLEANGYHFRDNAGVEGRILFAKGREDLRTHYLHIEIINGELWKNHIYFRDYLRLNKKAVEEYSRLKKVTALAIKYTNDRGSYTNAKNEFIKSVLKKAKEDFNLQNDYKIKYLTVENIELVDSLCKKCSDYYILSDGIMPSKDDSKEIFTSIPPNKSYEDKFVLGIFSCSNELIGIIDIVKDFPVNGQWMLGLMLIAPEERGKGLGKIVHEALVQWAIKLGAESFRIGVIEDNHKGIEFWIDLGYTKIKEVTMDFSKKKHIVNVMTLQVNKQ